VGETQQFADSTPVEKFESQVVTEPAASRVSILTTREARERNPGRAKKQQQQKVMTRLN